jgi:hypothetical protein
MTGYESKKAAAQNKLEPVDYEKLAALGWQAIECPFCGSSGAQAFPKPVVQPAQEPASVTYKEVQDSMNALEKGSLYQQVIAEELGGRKLYTTPPQRRWVGLTEEEQAALIYKYGDTPVALCLETERKLKEMNNAML